MPAPSTNTAFLGLVRRSGLVEDGRLDDWLGLRRADGDLPATPRLLADGLVADGLLTGFQADHLLQGKYLGFTIGKYLVQDLLGAGGMGLVYLCQHRHTRQHVAVKLLPRALAQDPVLVKRFYREARASIALDHPNLVRGYEVGQEQEHHLFVMEYLDGISLQDLVTRDGPLEIARAADYIRQAARALQHAHEAGLIHRDVKPANLMVDREGTVKVLDLGLSLHTTAEESVLTRDVVGTIEYLAPEQARDSHAVDSRADVYALGATFYFLLTGSPPPGVFGAGRDGRLTPGQLAERLRELRPEVPQALAVFVGRMMAVNPRQRLQTPAAAVQGLLPWTRLPAPARTVEVPVVAGTAPGVAGSSAPWVGISLAVVACAALVAVLWQTFGQG
jgi:serine/threonine protein kinase